MPIDDIKQFVEELEKAGELKRVKTEIDSDLEIGKVDPNYLSEVLTKMETGSSDALFISCTALPVLKILDHVETKIKKTVLSSNQTLIWDSIRSVGYENPVNGYGKLFRN